MSFGSRLRDRRKELGITQPQLADSLGVSQSAIGSWETGVNSPRATLLYALFDILHCDANYLFQDETKELYKDEASPEEFRNIIKKYRALDAHGKEIVDFILDKEYGRSVESCSLRESGINYASLPDDVLHLALAAYDYEDKIEAAHERTDINVTDAMRKHDDDIMDSEDF